MPRNKKMDKAISQLSLFDLSLDSSERKSIDKKTYSTDIIEIPFEFIEKFKSYNIEAYIDDVANIGLEKLWDYICQFVIYNIYNIPTFLNVNNFGELYEIGLAIQDKILKKKSGQYYTPDDVATIMSNWLLNSKGDVVCDVACGTGKLILTYLDLIGYDASRELISSGNLYLYDFDNVALKICRTIIAVKYGPDIAGSIHDIFCDFLDSKIILPNNCKVISNPPYARIDEIQSCWEKSNILLDTKELYSAFMEKIFEQAESTVIITPFSFISGNKFYSLRKKMTEIGNGFIFSFDNVPGNIFCGRKHGIFNTNTANSVRAAITVFNKSNTLKGFKISPLIRFKNEERKNLLNNEILETSLPDIYQTIDKKHKKFEKLDNELLELFDSWNNHSELIVNDIISNESTNYFIDMPNTCRYYTTASSKKLKRTGSITINVIGEKEFNFLYCFINSSFVYWWWRIYDGGITYPKNLFEKIPLPLNLLSKEDILFFETMTKKLINEEQKYIVKKVNAGVAQENIKFPKEYRRKINERIIKILNLELDAAILEKVHANCYFEK